MEASQRKVHFGFKNEEEPSEDENSLEALFPHGSKRVKRDLNQTESEERITHELRRETHQEKLSMEKIQFQSFLRLQHQMKKEKERNASASKEVRLEAKLQEYRHYRLREGQGFVQAKSSKLNECLRALKKEKEIRSTSRPLRKRIALDDEPPQLYDLEKVTTALEKEKERRARFREEEKRRKEALEAQ